MSHRKSMVSHHQSVVSNHRRKLAAANKNIISSKRDYHLIQNIINDTRTTQQTTPSNWAKQPGPTSNRSQINHASKHKLSKDKHARNQLG